MDEIDNYSSAESEDLGLPDDEFEDFVDTETSEARISTQTSKTITGANRTTDMIMTKYEYTRLISALAKAYEEGLKTHSKLDQLLDEHRRNGEEIYDPLDLAEIHVRNQDIPCPIHIERVMPDKSIEIWYLAEMILPHDTVNRAKTRMVKK